MNCHEHTFHLKSYILQAGVTHMNVGMSVISQHGFEHNIRYIFKTYTDDAIIAIPPVAAL